MIYKLLCKNCQNFNKIRGSFNDRWEFQKKMKSKTMIICNYCSKKVHLNPNEVTAHLNVFSVSILTLVAILFLIFILYVFYNLIGHELYLKVVFLLFSLIIISIYLNLIIGSMFTRVNDFNKYKL